MIATRLKFVPWMENTLTSLWTRFSPMKFKEKMGKNEQGFKQYIDQTTLKISSTGNYEFKSIHYYGNFQFSYSSPIRLLILDGLRLFLLELLYMNLKQWLFNQSTKERTDRILLLKELVQIRIQNEID